MRAHARTLTTAVLAVVQSCGTTTYAVTFGPGTSYTVGNGPLGIVAGDFNGDGRLDLAVANSGSGSISVLIGNGDGTFQPALNTPAGTTPWALTVADLNGDGHQDLVVADEAGSVLVLLGKGGGTFQPADAIALDA